MPKFLSQQETYRLIQRELPEDVYPDGSPSGSFSTASVYAKSKVIASVYANLARIYDNYFPQTALERLDDWEVTVFGQVQQAIDTQDRRDLILAKLRSQPDITLWQVLTLVAGYVPQGTFVQIVELSNYGWRLGVSRLGLDTQLNMSRGYAAPYGDECGAGNLAGWKLGVSLLGDNTELAQTGHYQNIALAQVQAYAYIIRIFDYEVTGDVYERMVREIKKAEPARSGHFIQQNQSLAAYNLIVPVTDVTQFDLVNCITRDTASTTGYSGRRTP